MKVVMFLDFKSEWRFRIVSRNNKIIASSESYKEKRSCLKTIKAIIKGVSKAKVVEE